MIINTSSRSASPQKSAVQKGTCRDDIRRQPAGLSHHVRRSINHLLARLCGLAHLFASRRPAALGRRIAIPGSHIGGFREACPHRVWAGHVAGALPPPLCPTCFYCFLQRGESASEHMN